MGLSESKPLPMLFLTTSGVIGGAERTILYLIRALSRQKYRITVLTLTGPDDLVERATALGIEAHNLKLKSPWQVYRLIRLLPIFRRRYKVLYSFLFHANVVGRILGRFYGVPIIVSGQRNVEVERRLWRKWLDTLTANWLADVVVGNSQAIADWLLEQGVSGAKIQVIMNGVDVDELKRSPDEIQRVRINLQVPKDATMVSTVAHFSRKKGHRYLIEAAKLLSRQEKQIVYVLVGDGRSRQAIEEFARSLEVDGLIRFVGSVREPAAIVAASDFFVLPSLWEGMPNAVMEAMALGKAVIATRVGGVPELVAHNESGILVPPGDAEALARAIEDLIDNPVKRERLAGCARQLVADKFRLEHTVEQTENLFETLIWKKDGFHK